MPAVPETVCLWWFFEESHENPYWRKTIRVPIMQEIIHTV